MDTQDQSLITTLYQLPPTQHSHHAWLAQEGGNGLLEENYREHLPGLKISS
ncbi:hypothetical protein PCANC_09588 [Puccinia coronata f. sp. avenae]|uniref:Uncharacterized protein n=1 Tax=Puccinia coronata f. sp. avenae TaxID=200324 RepID=A0A2N5V9U6_9BASI|nr:hypothetical protein PCANC_09588 [Puccinia coronata f. sp. avenae]